MKKKLLFKFFVFTVIGSLLTVTSCKDYDDDINSLDSKISQTQSTLSTLQTQLTTLETALAAAQADAAAAKTAADAAKAAADEAKAAAEEAKAAVGESTADAIKATIDELAALITELETAIDQKLDISVYNGDMVILNGKIDAINEDINVLKLDLTEAENAISDLVKADEALQIQLDALKLYAEATQTDLEAAQQDIIKAQADIETLIGKVDELTENFEALKEAIEDDYDNFMDLIDGINDEINRIEKEISTINTNLSTLRSVVTNRLTAITLASNVYVDGIEAVSFSSLVYKPMGPGENELIPSSGYDHSTAAPAIASYKFNPRSFVLTNADYSYVDRTATIITRATGSNLVQIEGDPEYNATDGTVNFTLRRIDVQNTQPEPGKDNFIQLEATLKGDAIDVDETGVVISAPQELVYDKIYDAMNFRIADKATLPTAGENAHYPVTFDDAVAGKIWYQDMTYDKIYDLKSKVATCASDGKHWAINIEDYNLKYKFSVASSAYNITVGSTTTNQQSWIELVDSDEGTYQAEDFSKEAIGRTPILKVELVDVDGNVVRRAFVKVKIGVSKSPDITVGGTVYDLVFQCNKTPAKYEISEQYIRENLYRVITNGKESGMSHEEFWNLYEFDNALVTKNGVETGITAPYIVDGDAGTGTATKKIVWEFTHSEIGSVGIGGAILVGSVTVRNKLASSEYPAYITFQFIVNVTLPDFSVTKVENDEFWLKYEDGEYFAFKVNVKVPSSTSSPASECIFMTPLPQAYSVYEITNSSSACMTSEYKVTKTFADGAVTAQVLKGVKIIGNNITLDKSDDVVKAALNSPGGLQAEVSHVVTLENGDEIIVNQFLVHFIRPINLNMPDGVTLQDAKTGGDVADIQWNSLLTDWRGEPIIKDTWVLVEESHSYWKNIFEPNLTWAEGHNEMVSPGKLEVVFDTIDFITSNPITMYTGSAEYLIRSRGIITGWLKEERFTVSTADAMGSKDLVDMYLSAKAYSIYQENINTFWDLFRNHELIQIGDNQYTEVIISGGQHIVYPYVKSITYVPPVIKWVPGGWVEDPSHKNTDPPTYDGTKNGDKSGDGNWEWVTETKSKDELVPGQYWDFYGVFESDIVEIDIKGVSTNLEYNGFKLPEGTLLQQVGNTVKYINTGTSLQYPYDIYLPVSVKYGWGTVTSILTIKVLPV